MMYVDSTVASSYQTYSGFAEPLPSFYLNSVVFTFATETEDQTVTVTADDQAVYKYGFISYDGQAWKPFELAGNALGGEWLNGSVSAGITFNAFDFNLFQSRLSTRNNFIVIYSCSRIANAWDCHDGWQIWQFNASLQSVPGGCDGDFQLPQTDQDYTGLVENADASYHDADYVPENVLDGDLSWNSRWSANGSHWISFSFPEEIVLNTVSIAFYHGDIRSAFFDIEVSCDGTGWVKVFDGQSGGLTEDFEDFTFNPAQARFVRINGYGNDDEDPTVSTWNSYLEVRFMFYADGEAPPCENCTPLAFPGAEGFAANTRGAYSGSDIPAILTVDTLEAGSVQTGSDSGSLEWCLRRDYPRIILFEVGGIIDYRGVKDQLFITEPYVSIYGQTAPWPGITILGTDFAIGSTHDVIIHHLKVRSGNNLSYGDPRIRDSLSVYGSNIIVDHCSISWATDETLAVAPGASDVTISNSIISHPLKQYLVESDGSVTEKAGFGVLIDGVYNISYLRNLIAYSRDRSPSVRADNFVFINNMNYVSKFVACPRIYDDGTGNPIHHAHVGNVMLRTAGTTDAMWTKYCGRIYSGVNPSSQLYFSDNICQLSIESPTNTDWENVLSDVTLTEQADSPIDLSGYTILDADLVEDYVLSNAGAFYWNRDDYDQLVVDMVASRTGEAILSPDDTPAHAYNFAIDDSDKLSFGDMTNGYNWASDNQEIVVNGNTLHLTRNCGNIQEVLDHLNEQMPEGTVAVEHPHPDLNHVILRTVAAGSGNTLTLSGDGLDTLGIAAWTYQGTDGIGGWPQYAQTQHQLSIPADPHNDLDGDGYTNLEEWVHEQAV